MLALGERAFVVLALFMLSGATQAMMSSDADLGAGGGSEFMTQIVFGPIYLIAFILAGTRLRTILGSLRRNIPVVALPLLALMSTAWSILPEASLRRSLALVGTFSFGLYLATRFDLKAVTRLTAYALFLVAVFSMAAVVLRPDVGIMEMPHEGAWRGFFVHKNIFGRIMGLGVVTSVAAAVVTPGLRSRFALFGVLCAVCLVLSQSRTALTVTTVVVLTMVPVSTIARARAVALVPGLIVLLGIIGIGGLIAVANREAILQGIGRDLTLTGRTALWAVLLVALSARPLLGFGYGAFWTETNVSGVGLLARTGWEAQHAHNGAIDMALDVGIVGVVLLGAGLVISAGRRVLAVRRADAGPYGLSFLLLVLGLSIAESVILKHHSIFFALFTCIAFTDVATVSSTRPRSRRLSIPPSSRE